MNNYRVYIEDSKQTSLEVFCSLESEAVDMYAKKLGYNDYIDFYNYNPEVMLKVEIIENTVDDTLNERGEFK